MSSVYLLAYRIALFLYFVALLHAILDAMLSNSAARLNETYAVDRCAVCIATSALWYMQLGQIDAAIERCNYVAQHVLPTFDESDTIGMFTCLMAIIRVLKWNNHVDRARELYEQYIPEGTENHFAVGCIHLPLSLLLKVCEGSSLKYSVADSDIELALNFEVNDFSDNIFTSDGWSMNSLGAELCLHLARRLKPGEGQREDLLKKGIQLSSVADSRVKSSHGLVKHIIAYEAHRDVYLNLLGMAGIDAKTPRKSVFETVSRRSTMMVSVFDSVKRRSAMMVGDSTESHYNDNSTKERDIVKRLVFKEESMPASNQTKTSSGSGESKVDSFEKKTKSMRPRQISNRLMLKEAPSSSPKHSGSSLSASKDEMAVSFKNQIVSRLSRNTNGSLLSENSIPE